jgi:DNA-binding CsgD family transcriptional regulator
MLIERVREQLGRNEALIARVHAMLTEALDCLERQKAEPMGVAAAVPGPDRVPDRAHAQVGTAGVRTVGTTPLAVVPPALTRSSGRAGTMERRVRTTDPPGHPSASDPPRRRLTPREREVAQLVADGLKDLVIARRLGLARSTVTTHVRRIQHRLDLTGRDAIVAWLAARRSPVDRATGRPPAHNRDGEGLHGGVAGATAIVRVGAVRRGAPNSGRAPAIRQHNLSDPCTPPVADWH